MYKSPIFLSLLLLSACSNKNNIKPFSKALLDKNIYVVLDYVEYKDDIGKLLNYDLHTNNKRMMSLQTQIENLLVEKGYSKYQFIFSSSGIDFNPDIDFMLIKNNEKTETLIRAPFITTSKFSNDALNQQFITGFKMAQEAASFKVHKDVIGINQFPVITNSSINPSESRKFETDSLILYARVISPQMSFGKQFLAAGITGALTLAATGGSSMFITTPYGPVYSNLVLVNNQDGEFLWRGKINMNMIRLTKKMLFKQLQDFPSKSQ